MIHQAGFDNEDFEFKLEKSVHASKRPILQLVYNLVMVIIAYITTFQFKRIHAWCFFMIYFGYFLNRLWSFVYHYLPKTMQAYPMFNITSSALLLMLITLHNEGQYLWLVFRDENLNTVCEGEACLNQK